MYGFCWSTHGAEDRDWPGADWFQQDNSTGKSWISRYWILMNTYFFWSTYSTLLSRSRGQRQHEFSCLRLRCSCCFCQQHLPVFIHSRPVHFHPVLADMAWADHCQSFAWKCEKTLGNIRKYLTPAPSYPEPDSPISSGTDRYWLDRIILTNIRIENHVLKTMKQVSLIFCKGGKRRFDQSEIFQTIFRTRTDAAA